MTGDTAIPLRIGVLRDVHVPGMHDFGGNALRLVVDEANEAGGIGGRPIELAWRVVEGHATGTPGHVAASVAAWRELADDPAVLGILGPSTTPSVLAVHEAVEAIGIPQVHWAGTDKACGDWHFQFQAGYLPDEGRALAYLFARMGHRTVVCFRGEGDYGAEYLGPFTAAAREMGIAVLGEFQAGHTASDLSAEVAAARALGADALVAMGLFGVGRVLARNMREAGWDIPCYGNCGFPLTAAGSAELRRLFDGWIATDMLDPANAAARALFDRYEARHGLRPASATSCFGHDLGLLAVEALRRAPEFTREGLRRGLEAVRGVPAATGGAGSYLSLTARERLALKGPRLFVFSRITPAGLQLHPA